MIGVFSHVCGTSCMSWLTPMAYGIYVVGGTFKLNLNEILIPQTRGLVTLFKLDMFTII